MPYQRIKCNLRGGEITDSEIKTEIKHAKFKYFMKQLATQYVCKFFVYDKSSSSMVGYMWFNFVCVIGVNRIIFVFTSYYRSKKYPLVFFIQ